MSKKIHSKIELQVIHNWLKGMNRDENSSNCGIATGSVSNIKNKWLDLLFGYDIETVREFAVRVRKENLTIKDCALGYRIYSILQHLGIDESDTNLLSFLKNAYDLCEKLDVTPHILQDCLEEMLEISKEIAPSQLRFYIEKKFEEKEKLESKIRNLKEEIKKLENIKDDAQEEFSSIKNKIDMTSAQFDWYLKIKDSLEKEGLPVEDISYLTRTVKMIKKTSNDDIFQVLQKIAKSKNLDKEMESKKMRCDVLDVELKSKEKIDLKFSENLNSKKDILDTLEEIKKLGIDFKEMKILKQVLDDIFFENGYRISPSEIKERFFQILSSFRRNRMLETEKETLEDILIVLENEINEKRLIILSQGSCKIILRNLLNKGLNEYDIFLVKKFRDKIEKINLRFNSLGDILCSYFIELILHDRNKKKEEINIKPVPEYPNPIINKEFNPSLEKNKNNKNNIKIF